VVRIKDIAKHTGISAATISKYLNGQKISGENERILGAAVAEFKYEMNEVARALRKKRSNMIGILVSELNSAFTIDIVSRIERLLKGRGYGVIVSDCGLDKGEERKTVNYFLGKGIDGIISMPYTQTGDEYGRAFESGIPVVFWDNMAGNADILLKADVVVGDNREASYGAARYLTDRGHRKIGVVLGGDYNYPSVERLKGWRMAIADGGASPDERYICRCAFDIGEAAETVKRFLSEQKDMTALIAGGYQFSAGLVIALNELKIKVPDELSVIIYDDVLINGLYPVRLANVSQSADAMARNVVDLMAQRLDEPKEPPAPKRVTRVAAAFFEGESVRALN
jgi:LacI family transcriptional regulator